MYTVPKLVPPPRRIHRIPFAPTVLAALALCVGCNGPQTGTPGLEPPHEVNDSGASGSSAGSGGSASPATSNSGSGGAAPVTPPPTAGAGAAGSGAGAAGAGNNPDTLADSPSCEPVGETLDIYAIYERDEDCDHPPAPESGVPNFDSTWIQDLPLTTPLVPGEPYAITLSPSNDWMRGQIEIWGSDEACGVDELLWYGDMDGRVQCVELMPTRPHSRLQFVSRRLEPGGSFSAGVAPVVLCPGGSCPAGSDGHPLEAGVTLEPKVGAYALNCTGAEVPGLSCETGVLGQLLLIDEPGATDPTYEDFASGVFRLPPNDPYGDAWYCIGGGSRLLEADDHSRFDLHLAEISKLPPCEGGSSTASFEWMSSDSSVTVTSDVAELAGADLDRESRCFENRCRFSFYDSVARSVTHLFVTLDGKIVDANASIDLQVLEAAWFTVPSTGSPVRRACSTSGVLHYDYGASSSLELDAIGDFVSCPGEPLDEPTLDLLGGRPIDL